MIDARLVLGAAGADLALEGGDLALDLGLQTAVLVSLFSDARAPADAFLPSLDGQRRGWWAQTPGDPHGSLLWLLDRAKLTPETVNAAREWTAAALRWLTDLGIASRVEVTTRVPSAGLLEIDVALHRGAGLRWGPLWEATREAVHAQGAVVVRILPG